MLSRVIKHQGQLCHLRATYFVGLLVLKKVNELIVTPCEVRVVNYNYTSKDEIFRIGFLFHLQYQIQIKSVVSEIKFENWQRQGHCMLILWAY
jgi:hypothetical protein